MARRFSGGRATRPRRIGGSGETMIQRSRSVSATAKAAFHQIDGAGKRHTKREFFGLTAADEQAIVDRVERALDEAMKEA